MSHSQGKKSLDTKILSLMEGQLNQEVILYKKYLNAAEKAYNAELKSIFYESSKKHKCNYQNLLSYLKS